MPEVSYHMRRQQLTEYFDFRAQEQWVALTGDSPVSRIRQTVRDGRATMQGLLKSWLPGDLHQARVLDAGCGTGTLAMALAQRGAHVVAVDGAANLIEHASQQVLPDRTTGSIEWVVGDMLDPSLGEFDYVVAMDSLIHYRPRDVEAAVQTLAFQARQGLLFTIAPSTPMLRLMHVSGLLFPKSDRAPDIQPITVGRLCRRLTPAMQDQRWRLLNSQRVANFFYTSHALGWVRP